MILGCFVTTEERMESDSVARSVASANFSMVELGIQSTRDLLLEKTSSRTEGIEAVSTWKN